MLELPSDAEALRRLSDLGVGPDDREATLAARPDPRRHPALWRHLEGCHEELISRMGEGLPADGYRALPTMGADAGSVALHLYVWLYLTALPETLRFHERRGIPETTSAETLFGLGEAIVAHRSMHGRGGIGWFGQWCPPLKFRGAEYRLGRLEYDRGRGELPDGAPGQLLNMHIPSGRPLSAESCDESLDLAGAFFPRHFPEERVSHFVCHSWLLDPQLAEYLPEESNLVRFLRRFELKPLDADDPERSDTQILEYAFGLSPEGEITADRLADLPRDTTLRRTYVEHLRSGRHWYTRTGWIPFRAGR